MSEYICPAAPEVTHCYNAKAVRELIRQARMDALEEAALAAEMHITRAGMTLPNWERVELTPEIIAMFNSLSRHRAAAIRALKEKTPDV